MRPTTFFLMALALATMTFAVVLSYTDSFGPPPNYSLIEPGLYLGGSGPKPPDATAVLSITPYRDTYTADVYLCSPIITFHPPPTLEWLSRQVHFIDTQRRAGRTVFVHCDAGVDRSATVLIAYLMWRDHRPLSETLALVRSRRPVANPNPTLLKVLEQWQRSLTVATPATR